MGKRILVLVIAVIVGGSCRGGWERIYGGSGYDEMNSMCETHDGGFIIAGVSNCMFGTIEVYLFKIDLNGDMIWERGYEGLNDDYCHIFPTTDNGFIIASDQCNFVKLMKLNSSGDSVWCQSYYKEGYSGFYSSITQTADNGYIAVGCFHISGEPSDDIYILKVDSTGSFQWDKSICGSSWDESYAVFQTTDNGYIIAGCTASYGDPSGDAFLMKINEFGDSIWLNTYGRENEDNAYAAERTSDGGFILAGSTGMTGSGLFDVYLAKTDSTGELLWSQTFGVGTYNEARSVKQTSDNGYIITGRTIPYGLSYPDGYLIKTDSLGNLLWERYYGDALSSELFESVVEIPDNGFIAAGNSTQDIYVIRTDSLGYTSIYEINTFYPSVFALFAYPNPFNSTVKIMIETPSLSSPLAGEMPQAEGVTVEIFDLSGRRVAELIPPGPPLTRGEAEKSHLSRGEVEKSPLSSGEAEKSHLSRGEAEKSPLSKGDLGGLVWSPDESLASGVYLVRARFGGRGDLAPTGVAAVKRIVYLK